MIDTTGAARAATILSVASGQTTFVAPAALAAGPAGLVATGTDGTVSYGSAPVATVAPALFAALPSGQIIELYGTGIRGRSSLTAVTCAIGGVEVPVLYAGPQVRLPGSRPGQCRATVIVGGRWRDHRRADGGRRPNQPSADSDPMIHGAH